MSWQEEVRIVARRLDTYANLLIPGRDDLGRRLREEAESLLVIANAATIDDATIERVIEKFLASPVKSSELTWGSLSQGKTEVPPRTDLPTPTLNGFPVVYTDGTVHEIPCFPDTVVEEASK